MSEPTEPKEPETLETADSAEPAGDGITGYVRNAMPERGRPSFIQPIYRPGTNEVEAWDTWAVQSTGYAGVDQMLGRAFAWQTIAWAKEHNNPDLLASVLYGVATMPRRKPYWDTISIDMTFMREMALAMFGKQPCATLADPAVKAAARDVLGLNDDDTTPRVGESVH